MSDDPTGFARDLSEGDRPVGPDPVDGPEESVIHDVSDGIEDPGGLTVMDRLTSRSPEPDLSEEVGLDLKQGGVPRIVRGIRKIALAGEESGEGVPAAVDVALGALETYMDQQRDDGSTGSGETETETESAVDRSDDMGGGHGDLVDKGALPPELK